MSLRGLPQSLLRGVAGFLQDQTLPKTPPGAHRQKCSQAYSFYRVLGIQEQCCFLRTEKRVDCLLGTLTFFVAGRNIGLHKVKIMGFSAFFARGVFHIINRVIHREIKKSPRQTLCLQGGAVDNRRFSTVIHNLELVYIKTDK